MKLTVHNLLLTSALEIITFPFQNHIRIPLLFSVFERARACELWVVNQAAVNNFSINSKIRGCLHCWTILRSWENERMRRISEKNRIFSYSFFLSACELYYNNLIEWNGSRALWFYICLNFVVYCLVQYFSLKKDFGLCDFCHTVLLLRSYE